MRTGRWLAALLLAAGLAGPARAQRAVPWGSNNAPIQYVVVGPNGTKQPIASPQQLGASKFSLNSFFHTPSTFSANPVHGHSVFPTQDQMPGVDYLKLFRYRRGKP
jgi:hypothetical protein